MSIARGRPAGLLEASPASSERQLGGDTDRRVWTTLLTGAVAVSVLAAVLGRDVVNSAGWDAFASFWRAAARPELSPGFVALTLDATLTTLSYALLGSLLSVVLGLAGGVLAARATWASSARLRSLLGVGLTRGGLSLPRGVHEVVWGLLLVNVLGSDPLVAVLAIGIPYGAITAKVFAEILDEAPQQPFRSLRATGSRLPGALLYGLGPVALKDLVSYVFYRFECSIRAAAILGLIGAGGLGYELSLSFRTLRYDEMWTLIYALIILSGLTDLWSSSLRRALAGARGRDGSRPMLGSSGAFALLAVAAALYLKLDPTTPWSARAMDQLAFVVGSLWPPQLPADTWPDVLRAVTRTVQMSIIATFIAATGGALFSLLVDAEPRASGAASGALSSLRTIATKGLLLLFRAIPPPVWALVLLFVFLPGVVPGALALGVYNMGILGRLMYEATENLDARPRSAIASIGASGPKSFLYGSAPRLSARFLALSLYRWEVTTRETVVVGVVGAAGIGRLLSDDLAAFDWPEVTGSLVALIVVTLAVDAVSAFARRAFR